MLQVIFKKLSIKNFLSIGDEPIEVDFKTGLNIITGKNYDKLDRRNGVGKSTIVDALHFAIFGSTIRELTKEHIVNNVTNGKCVVCVDFDVTNNGITDIYRIERTLNGSSCALIKNKEIITRGGIPQTNDLIGQIIQSTPEMFQNSVIMTVNNTIPFMSQKKTDKRKFIEGILNLSSFSDMLLLARKDYNENKNNFDIESAKMAEVDKTVKMLKAQQEVFDAEKQKKLDDICKRIKDHETEIEVATKNLVIIDPEESIKINGNIKTLKDNLKRIDTDIESAQKTKAMAEFTITSIKDKLKEIAIKKGTCGFCGKDIDTLLECQNDLKIKQHNADIIIAETGIKEQTDKIVGYRSQKEKINQAITKLETLLLDITLKTKENNNIQNNISQIKKWIKLLKDTEQEVINNKGNFAKDLTHSENRHKELLTKTTEYKDKLEIIDAAKFVVSEEGVKSILVKKILKILNTKLSYYLKKMQANCVITFNEFFEENIVNENGKECVYYNFSGAERKAIDLACLFTFMDIRRLQGNLSINISMYDELLDSSMDEKGVDLVLDILKERIDKYKEAVYIISHRQESVKHVTGDIIFIVKKDGISRCIPYESLDNT